MSDNKYKGKLEFVDLGAGEFHLVTSEGRFKLLIPVSPEDKVYSALSSCVGTVVSLFASEDPDVLTAGGFSAPVLTVTGLAN